MLTSTTPSIDLNSESTIHSTSISPVTDYGYESYQEILDQNCDLFENILAFLDERNPSSLLHSPTLSSHCNSVPDNIEQWVEEVSTSRIMIPALCLPPSPLQISRADSPSLRTSTSSPLPVSNISDIGKKKITSPCQSSLSSPEKPMTGLSKNHTASCSLVLSDLILPLKTEPITPSPPLPERSHNRGSKQHKISAFISKSDNDRLSAVPDLKGNTDNNLNIKAIVKDLTDFYSLSTERIPNEKRFLAPVPGLPEFNFPIPPHDENSIACESSEIVTKNQLDGRQYSGLLNPTQTLTQNGTSSTLKLLPHKTENTPGVNHRETNVKELDPKKIATLKVPRCKAPFSISNKLSSHSHSTSCTPLKSNTTTSLISLVNYGVSENSVPTRLRVSAPVLVGTLKSSQRSAAVPREIEKTHGDTNTPNSKLRAKTESVTVIDLMRKNHAPGIKLGMRLIAEKRDLLNACCVVSSEPRLLTLRRRTLTGTKFEWLVVDNGMAVRKSTTHGRSVLRCLGQTDGKVDFFTAEGIPIFRFQKTVGSTRSATLIDKDYDRVYFSVRDGSWDCIAHWEVSLFDSKDQKEGEWLVSGDQHMRGLDIKQGDLIVGMIRDSGDHEYTLKVFPDKNWCIITALATFFDEWRVSHVGLAI